MANYLICYDIANPKRLGRVHRRMVKHAMFVQYSVYYLQGSEADLKKAMDDIAAVINENEDDVRAYTVRPLKEAIVVGQSWLPPEVLLL